MKNPLENEILFNDLAVLESRLGSQFFNNPLADMVNDCINKTDTQDGNEFNTPQIA